MSSTWKAALGIILIFILGWVGGTLTTLLVVRHKAIAVMNRGPEAIAIVLERQTIRTLGVDADKKQQIHQLIVQNVQARMSLQKEIQPQVKALNRQTLDQINALLTPDQQQNFHENLVLFKDRFGRNPFNVGSEQGIGTPPSDPDPAPAPVPMTSEGINAGMYTNNPATYSNEPGTYTNRPVNTPK